MSLLPFPPPHVLTALRQGLVIPAHPLALNSKRQLDEKRQRALTRYYCEAGAGGLAVGVHTTQFEIRDPKFSLYEPVLTLAAETIDTIAAATGRTIVKIAGIAGSTVQAVKEAKLAADLGYHLGMVSLGALHTFSNPELIAHLCVIAEAIPIMGFYLQPAVGGRVLDYEFWRQAVEIENLCAIKIAPFNRYFTLEVVRAVAEAGRENEIALYTGNDDNIVIDLLSEFQFTGQRETPRLRIVGGLLGHWAVWTKKAVELLEEIHQIKRQHQAIPSELLLRAQQITDANGAIFDAHHNFAGCIPGIHEILRRQGLLEGRWTLNPNEELSPGQLVQIDRIYRAYPHLRDDDFVKENLDRWLK
ncbi:MAG: dihydrodipicolinate synthase family protein [candidate division KSB1 bacterium]|nr:dihydrodipicolinate synthase family protein [candidate division KSB1 bacterium]MDZ7301319.1 dihydrodipicolinate synthase family protein [candidate division KSB1 bacterium]MDZ7310796.1 dihydrodipicolinate synthase family protein [candidate division KSB1 bacterium]